MSNLVQNRVVHGVYKFFFRQNELVKYSVERLMFLPPVDEFSFYGQQINKFLYEHMYYDKMKRKHHLGFKY